MTTQIVPTQEFMHRFLRLDKHERSRKLVRTESYRVAALHHWMNRKLKRMSQASGIAFSWPPAIDFQRRPDIRGTEWYVWVEFALLEGRPGVMLAAPHEKRGSEL